MPLLLQDPAASELVGAAVVAMLAGEFGATYVGRARDGERRLIGSLAESLLLVRRRGAGESQDRWTKWIIVLASRVAIVAALRAWAILTLGRYFRREVTIEPGQMLVRRGPYRVLRHPSYTGIMLSVAGLGLAFGSWVGAAVALLVMFAGMLPGSGSRNRRLPGRSAPGTRAPRPGWCPTSGSSGVILPAVGGRSL